MRYQEDKLGVIPDIVWHYTKADYLPLIEDSGELRPKSEQEVYKGASGLNLHVSNTPFIWFSSNQLWEPLSPQLGGGLRSRNVSWQQLAYEHFAIRFGIKSSDERLLNWKQTCVAGGANREERRLREKLAVQAKKMGSDATKWFTSLEPIPLKDLRFQIWLRDEWVDDDL